MKEPLQYTLLFIQLFLLPQGTFAQGEQNIWMISANPRGGTTRAISFNNGSPILFNPPTSASNAVCDAIGQPLFYTDGLRVSDRNGRTMPNGNNLIYPRAGTGYSIPPIIAPMVQNGNRYAVITQRNGGLYYSIVDMQANNGFGDVLPGRKNAPINAFAGREGIATDSKLVTIQGCSGSWLVSRSRFVNQFRAYLIEKDSIRAEPVISEVGLLPLNFYPGRSYSGLLKASPDGKKLALACGLAQTDIYTADGAIELYDFDKCNGTLSSPLILDSGTHYYSVCFSPDNSKLYATTIEWPGNVYQFDLSLATTAAIRASKTLVFANPLYWAYNLLQGWHTVRDKLGDLKAGPDGKIYISNGFDGCACYVAPSTLSSRYNGGYHVINNPNQPGLACNPAANVIRTTVMGIDLPPDIILPPVQDNLYRSLRQLTVCFRDSILLQADTPGRCYRWDDGSDQPAHMAYHPGIYYVQYTDDQCNLHIDSFTVQFVQAPQPGIPSYSCPNEQKGIAVMLHPEDEITSFRYRWTDKYGAAVHTHQSRSGDTATGLFPGRYSIQISTASGCDTTLFADVLPLPVPKASFDADTIICKGQALRFTQTSGTLLWQWHFGDGKSSKEQHPEHCYAAAGSYDALLIAENIEGCRDTAHKRIQVKELDLSLLATPDVASKGESVSLQSIAPEPYSSTAWLPEHFFSDQQAYRQQVALDTTRLFTVIARSAYDCTDTATAWVTMHPVLFLPSAFSPNGDGINDYFRPSLSGGTVTISSFRIFDRWGREVWSGQGSATGAVGWDGSVQGMPAPLGVYYYHIEAATHTGRFISRKGDVTLVR